MSRRRVVALVRRIVQEVRRDRPSIGLLFVAPILLTGLVAFIVREADAPPVAAAIVEPSGPVGAALGDAFTTALLEDGGSVTVVADEAAARAAVDTGDVGVAVLLPTTPPAGEGVTITVITDGLDPGGEAAQIAAVQRALLSITGTLTGATIPTIEHETIHGVPSADPITRYAPAIVGFFAYFFVYMLTGVSFLRERTGGTLERLMATPVARGEIVVGYTVGFAIFATIQVVVLLLWTLGSVQVPEIGPLPAFSVGLGVPMAGSPALAFLVVLLVAIGAVSLGIFLSTFARTELQVIQFIPLVIAPQFLLSGILFPVSSLPAILQPLSAIMPVTYAVDGLRQVFIAGADLGVPELQADLLILAGFAIVF
ncbi:MAG TPA: ABC transporter permease, partial [Candidatus Limnocylindrales bacterium]